MLERLSEHAGGDPAIGLLAALVRLDLAADDSASAKLRAAIQRFPANRRLPELFEVESGGAGLPATSTRIRPARIPPANPRADSTRTPTLIAVIRALESRCEALGVDPSLLPAAAFRVAGIAACRGAEQRKAGRLDDARQTAACLSAFAKTLARRDPNEAAFHLVLCEAFVQESKNAWKVKDYTAIEDALRKALGEACTALRLDPRNARRAPRGRHSPGQAGRSAFGTKVIAVRVGPRRVGRRTLPRDGPAAHRIGSAGKSARLSRLAVRLPREGRIGDRAGTGTSLNHPAGWVIRVVLAAKPGPVDAFAPSPAARRLRPPPDPAGPPTGGASACRE